MNEVQFKMLEADYEKAKEIRRKIADTDLTKRNLEAMTRESIPVLDVGGLRIPVGSKVIEAAAKELEDKIAILRSEFSAL